MMSQQLRQQLVLLDHTIPGRGNDLAALDRIVDLYVCESLTCIL